MNWQNHTWTKHFLTVIPYSQIASTSPVIALIRLQCFVLHLFIGNTLVSVTLNPPLDFQHQIQNFVSLQKTNQTVLQENIWAGLSAKIQSYNKEVNHSHIRASLALTPSKRTRISLSGMITVAEHMAYHSASAFNLSNQVSMLTAMLGVY